MEKSLIREANKKIFFTKIGGQNLETQGAARQILTAVFGTS